MEILLLAGVPLVVLCLAASLLLAHRLRADVERAIAGAWRAADRRAAAGRAEAREDLERLERAHARLEDAYQAKSRFVSVAAHDLRTPLASIRGFAGLLAKRCGLPPEQRRFASNVLVAAEQAARLTADLSDLAMIEAGRFTIEPEAFDAVRLARELVGSLELAAGAKRVSLSLRAPAHRVEIVADRGRVAQAVSNLVANALKFTDAGGRVEVGLEPSGAGIVFSVQDTGPGIHPDEREKVFDPFYQSPRGARAARRSGWGLGLFVVREIARLHGGAVGVRSGGPGRGSTFWLRLPALPRRSVAKAALLAAAAAALLVFRPAPSRAEDGPIEQTVKLDQALEARADEVLRIALGPERAKTVVDASLDLSRIERFRLLPSPASRPEGVPPNYERMSGFSPELIRRVNVTLLVDRRVPAREKERALELVGAALRLDKNRGDRIGLVETDFASGWRRLWTASGEAGLARAIGWLLFAGAALALTWVGLRRIVDALGRPITPQIGEQATTAKEQQGSSTEEVAVSPHPGPLPLRGRGEAGEERPGLSVPGAQMGALLALLEGQDPDNVALVLACLDAEGRRALLSRLPVRAKAATLARLANVRFVDPDLLAAIREELQSRLGAAVGGLHEVCRIIDEAEPSAQREILGALQEADPELARFVRPHVLLIEDLAHLDDSDWGKLAGRVRLVDWAAAAQDASPEFIEHLRSRLPADTWSAIEREREQRPASRERVREAQTAILDHACRLISSGRIRNPLAVPDAPAGAEPRKEVEA